MDNTISGFELTYKPTNAQKRTALHHKLFGRVVGRNYRGRKYGAYISGMLHDTKFCRIADNKIFLFSTDAIDMQILNSYATVTIEKKEMEILEGNLTTGEEYWKKHCAEKCLPLRERRIRRGFSDMIF